MSIIVAKDAGAEFIADEWRITMYAQLLMFTLGVGMRATAEKIADEFTVVHKPLKGFKSAIYLGDEASGEYGSLTIWETPEDIKTASNILQPKLKESLSGIAKGAPTVRIFEIYEPKA
ncbi:hypothetical protein ACFLXC_04075 [Chloroflexota bacterium]